MRTRRPYSRKNYFKIVLYLVPVLLLGTGYIWFTTHDATQMQAAFFDIDESQLELNDLINGEEITASADSYTFDITDNALPGGRAIIDTKLNMQTLTPNTAWDSVFALESGGTNPSPYQIIVLAKVIEIIDADNVRMQFGLYMADPGIKPEETIVWGGKALPASEAGEEAIITISDDNLSYILEWGGMGQTGANAELQVVATKSWAPLAVISTSLASASFSGGNARLTIGATTTCDASTDALAGVTFIKASILAHEDDKNVNMTYSCDTELFNIEVPDLGIEEGEMPGTGVIIQDRINMLPIDITRVVPDASGASLYYESSIQEMKVVATVDPNGNGDYRTVDEALKFIDEGVIAMAGGEYYVESIAVPNGVTLSGGWDSYGFRTQDFVNNPTYIFQIGNADSLINLTGERSNIEGLIVTGQNTCVTAAGRAHKITNNVFRDCTTGIHIFGVAYAHIVNNTFYLFETGILLEDFSASKIVNNIFKSGNIAIQENSAS